MPKRTAKQILYGLLYLGFWAAVASFVYVVWFSSPASCFDNAKNQDETDIDCGGVSCISCELKHIQALAHEQVVVLRVGNKVTLAAKIINQNPTYGASQFDYTFEVYAADNSLIKAIKGKSFVYGAEFVYLIEPGLTLDFQKIARVDLAIENPEWKSPEEFLSPRLEVREVKTETSGNEIKITGVIVNNDTLTLSFATMQALLKDKFGNIRGASQTEVRDVAPFENRRFEIHHPVLPEIDIAKTEIRAPRATF